MNIWIIIKSMSKQLLITAIVIAIAVAVMTVNPTAGIILMMLYSSWMVVKSSSKEMPLGKFTAILPGLMSLAIFFIMISLIGVHDEEMPLIGLGLGVLPGWLLARGHKIYNKNGIVYAKRTFFYVFIWALSLLFTQGSTLLGMREITDFGFLLNGFSTAMMVVLSVILFRKITSIRSTMDNSGNRGTTSMLLIPIVITLLTFSISVKAQNTFTPGNASSMGSYSGAPPAVPDWGVRYGKTEYRAIFSPKGASMLNARKGRWTQTTQSSSVDIWKKLNSWNFSGGRLIVDWDQNVATLEPIYTTASISIKTRFNTSGKINVKHEEETETLYLKDKQTGTGTYTLSPIVHGLGHPVSIGPGSLAGNISTNTGFYIKNSTISWGTRKDNNFPFDKNNPKSHSSNEYDKQFPGCLSAYVYMQPITQEAVEASGIKKSEGVFTKVIFIPVKTVGRPPASPNLLGEVGSQDSGWGKSTELTGIQVYKGRFLRASPSSKDKKDGVDVCTNVRNALCNDTELTIDWDSQRANLSSFSIQWDASNTYIYQGQKHVKQNSAKVMESFKPVKDRSAKVTFNSYAFRDISGGQLTYSHYENYSSTYSKKDIKRTFDPVLFRNKPVKIQWQAIPWKNGSILVRLYVRPTSQYYSIVFQDSPAYFDIVFEKTTQKSIVSEEDSSRTDEVEPKPTPHPDPVDPSELEFSDTELAAGVGAALLMLLASGGMIAAQASGSLLMQAAEEAVLDANLESNYSLFDPYDDEQLHEEDGMYWDGYGEQWMTRDEAEHFISKLNQEKSEEDSSREHELDAFEEQNERDREERQSDREERLRSEGNIYDEEQDTWEKDPDYVPPRTNLDKFYDQVDYLDEHSHQLSDDRKEIVERILDRIGYENNAIDATNLTDENMQTMGNLTKSINTIIHSENEANIAEQDSATFQNYENVGLGFEWLGRQAGEAAELVLTKGQTKGAITSFIFETAGNHDKYKSIGDNLKNSTIESVKTYSGNRWSEFADEADTVGRVTINATWGAMMETGEQLNEGKGMDGWEILKAAAENAITDEIRSYAANTAETELADIANTKRIANIEFDYLNSQNSLEPPELSYKSFKNLSEQLVTSFNDLRNQNLSEVSEGSYKIFKNLAERLDDI